MSAQNNWIKNKTRIFQFNKIIDDLSKLFLVNRMLWNMREPIAPFI